MKEHPHVLHELFDATYHVVTPTRPEDPQRIKRRGSAFQVYGISPSLLRWRDKKAEGRCRMCLRSREVRPLTEHHIIPNSKLKAHKTRWAIRNVAANKVPLCRPCHDLVEKEAASRRLLRRVLAPDEVSFAKQVDARYFDRRYPR